MEGLLRMDPKERFTSKDALCHPFFDGLRSPEDEQICQEYRSQHHGLRRQESQTHTGPRLQQQESSRSRSGLRANVQVIKAANMPQ
jgi:serine/threonine protein kinase